MRNECVNNVYFQIINRIDNMPRSNFLSLYVYVTCMISYVKVVTSDVVFEKSQAINNIGIVNLQINVHLGQLKENHKYLMKLMDKIESQKLFEALLHSVFIILYR